MAAMTLSGLDHTMSPPTIDPLSSTLDLPIERKAPIGILDLPLDIVNLIVKEVAIVYHPYPKIC